MLNLKNKKMDENSGNIDIDGVVMTIELINGKYTVNGKAANEMDDFELSFLWKFFSKVKESQKLLIN